MGMEHIFTGYDHLLFLFSLLVVTRTFRSALAVITAFTIAHSITLAISTFNLVHISSNITEPLIAVTIIYVAVENLVRSGEPHKRWLLTFSFGLIHGFGFATALREMGVSERAGGVLMPLFGFNMGVELEASSPWRPSCCQSSGSSGSGTIFLVSACRPAPPPWRWRAVSGLFSASGSISQDRKNTEATDELECNIFKSIY